MRKITSISGAYLWLYALCNDSTAWQHRDGKWERLPEIPQDGAGEALPAGDKPPSPNIPTKPLALRIAALFGRKPTTPWSDKEIAAWRKIKPQDIELDAIEAYYAGERSKRDGGVHRRDLGTFLNNYAGELDRATLAGFAGKAAPAKSKAQCIAEAATMFMRLTPESEAEWPRRKDGTHKTPDEVGAEMFAAQKGGAQ